jgi:CspA family cold shock protein
VENVREKGFCKWFDSARGYGFVTYAGNAEGIFCHHSAIKMPGYRSLIQGEEVEFEIQQNEKGFAAVNVVPLRLAQAATK